MLFISETNFAEITIQLFFLNVLNHFKNFFTMVSSISESERLSAESVCFIEDCIGLPSFFISIVPISFSILIFKLIDTAKSLFFIIEITTFVHNVIMEHTHVTTEHAHVARKRAHIATETSV